MGFFLDWIEDDQDIETIDDFDDLMKEVLYAYEDMYPILKQKDGIYVIYKLAIGKNWINYKGHYTRLAPGIYEQLDRFFSIEKV